MAYDPSDHYWMQADGRLFSSARLSWVDQSDAGYKAFVEAGGEPTRMPKDADGNESTVELEAVLRAAGVPASLVEYASQKQAALKLGGYAFNLGTKNAPQIAYADTRDGGRTDLNGLVSLAQLDPSFTTIWLQSEGNLSLNATQIIALGQAAGRFVVSTYPALAGVLKGIADGSVASKADVDAAAWPAASGSMPAVKA